MEKPAPSACAKPLPTWLRHSRNFFTSKKNGRSASRFLKRTAPMHIPSVIEKKRDGGELTADEISALIGAFTRGELPDYQMSALAMAIYFRGMTASETHHLTDAMMRSG